MSIYKGISDHACGQTPPGGPPTEVLQYARRAWPVHPLRPESKKPLLKSWPDRATMDPDRIRKWWNLYDAANVGVVTGQASGAFVLDVDGQAGRDSIDGRTIPPTPTVETPNGTHHYFRLPDGRAVRSVTGIMDGLDLKASGGYVVAPPSKHPNGGRYEWIITPEDAPLAEAPQWLLKRLKFKDDPDHRDSTDTRPVRIEASEADVTPADFWKRRNHGEAAEDTEPGQRNERTYRTKLTWVNAGLPPGQFDRWFLSDVLPKLDTGPGHDGEPFTEDEAREALRNAEKEKYQVNLPDHLQDYFTRSGGSSKPVQEPGTPSRCGWEPYELRKAFAGFLQRRQTVTYTSGESGCYQQLLKDLRDWINRAWPESKAPKLRTLKKAVKRLDKAGMIDRDTDRDGDGTASLRLRYTGPSDPKCKPRGTSNGVPPYLSGRADLEASGSGSSSDHSRPERSRPPNRGSPDHLLPEILAALESEDGLSAKGSGQDSGFSGDNCPMLERKKRRLKKMLESVEVPDFDPGEPPF